MDMTEYKHVIFENEMMLKESDSKFYKRLVVGLVRYISENKGIVNIPEEYFLNVPPNLGFETKTYSEGDIAGSVEEIRVIKLNDTWSCGIDDDGGTEEHIEDLYFFVPQDKLGLKLIVDNTKNED